MSVLVIDNYDSFTYNLVQYLGELGARGRGRAQRQGDGRRAARAPARPAGDLARAVHAGRGRDLDRGLARLPGGRDPDARASASATRRWSRRSAAARSAASRSTARTPRSSTTAPGSSPGCRTRCAAGRYHSLVADPELPSELERTATYGDVVMGVRHRSLPAVGVQFHPESVLTPEGKHLLQNFLRRLTSPATPATAVVAGLGSEGVGRCAPCVAFGAASVRIGRTGSPNCTKCRHIRHFVRFAPVGVGSVGSASGTNAGVATHLHPLTASRGPNPGHPPRAVADHALVHRPRGRSRARLAPPCPTTSSPARSTRSPPGSHLTADHASAVLDEVMEGRAGEVQTGGLPDRAAGEGRDGRRARRARADDAPARGLGRDLARRPRRHRRHRRRSVDLQHLDRRGAGRRRRGLRGRQARQPLQHQPLGLGRPARGARGPHRPRPGRASALHRRGRLRVHVRPAPPRGDEARGAGAQGARGAHDLQLPRPADQPGRREPPAARRLRSPLPGDDRRGARRARLRAGAGRLLRRRRRRDQHRRPHSGDRGRRRRHRGVVRRPRRTLGIAARRARPRSPAAAPAENAARRPRGVRRRRRARRATSSLLNAGAAILAAGGGARPRRGGRTGRARRSTRAPPQGVLERLVVLTNELARRADRHG